MSRNAADIDVMECNTLLLMGDSEAMTQLPKLAGINLLWVNAWGVAKASNGDDAGQPELGILGSPHLNTCKTAINGVGGRGDDPCPRWRLVCNEPPRLPWPYPDVRRAHGAE